MNKKITYTVSLGDPRAHRFELRCDIPSASSKPLVFRMAAWIRGSYLIRDLARHVFDLRAWRGTRAVQIERMDKSSFRVPGGRGAIRLEYRVHALDESVRKAFLDSRRGFFNGSSLFYCLDDDTDHAYELNLQRPADPAYAQWKAASTLPAVEVDEAGFGRYCAETFEVLMDHPFEMGNFQRQDFVADKVPHALVVSGRVEADLPRICSDLERICCAQRKMFGGEPALDQYLFLTNAVSAGYGGLEHRASTALICSRSDLPRAGQSGISTEYRTFLGLCSHEYFHLWNVKRITAKAFQDSTLAHEAYTRDLWHYEGVASYYDDLFLLRAKLIDAHGYLDLLAEQATRLQRSPARNMQTLADASFETWIKYYQPDDNSLNSSANYYVKGALAALYLDLELRLRSKVTLDDVMRALWQQFGRKDKGVPEGGLEAMAAKLSGLALGPVFDLLLRSTQDIPLIPRLAQFGVLAKLRACSSPIDNGGRTYAQGSMAYTGLRFRPGTTTVSHVLDGGPAQAAGLSAGDQLIALDGYRLSPQQWNQRLDAMPENVPAALHFFRDDDLLCVKFTPQAPAMDTWTFTLTAAKGAVLQRRKRWLGS